MKNCVWGWHPSMREGRSGPLFWETGGRPRPARSQMDIFLASLAESSNVAASARVTGILRDPLSNKPFVHFYATKRVGGAIIDSNAIKLFKFAAS